MDDSADEKIGEGVARHENADDRAVALIREVNLFAQGGLEHGQNRPIA
jgi:hypothetical protein